MKKSTLSLMIVLALIAALLGYNYFARPFAKFNQAAVTVTPAPEVSPAPVAQTDNLTAEQKVAMLLAYPIVVPKASSTSASVATNSAEILPLTPPVPSPELTQDLAWLSQHQPAMITLYGTKISSDTASSLISQIKAQYPASQSPMIAVDHEGGTNQPLNGTGFTTLPSWRSLCAQSATSSAQLVKQSLTEIKAAGVDVVLAPVVDVSAGNPVLGSRICSGDPDVVVTRATQYAELAKNLRLLPVFKHFPGIGASHLDLRQNFDRVTITANDALVYKKLLDNFPSVGVMVSPIGVINQFSDRPCTLSPDCIAELATNYPQTLIITDALDMKATSFVVTNDQIGVSGSASLKLTLPQVAEAAVRAGDQVLTFSQTVTASQMTEVYQHLVTTYQQDPDFQTLVNKAVIQIQGTRNQF